MKSMSRPLPPKQQLVACSAGSPIVRSYAYIEAHLGGKWADSFLENLHKDLKADFILANPPFNVSDWGGQRVREDVRWKYGTPPVGNAKYAWIQHFIHHLNPTGTAGFVMANGSVVEPVR